MNIAIIGTGSVGGNLARGWALAGHTIILGVRDPRDTRHAPLLAELGGKARAATPAEAARAAEVVVLATPWEATVALVKGLDLTGRTVVDATNPLAPQLAGLTVGGDSSGAEEVAGAAPGAHVVKCFNTTGANNFLSPRFPDGPATMFYCGDDAAAKETVRGLGAALGFEMADAGPLSRARLLEPLALLWITQAYAQGQGREIAFRLMRR
jgi:predicted dinucleotide-binding enzyme